MDKRFDFRISKEFVPSNFVEGQLTKSERERLEQIGYKMQVHKNETYYLYGIKCQPYIIIYFYGSRIRINCYDLLKRLYGKQKVTVKQLNDLYSGIISGQIKLSFDNYGFILLNDLQTRIKLDGMRYFKSLSHQCYTNRIEEIEYFEKRGYQRKDQDGLTIMYIPSEFDLEFLIKGRPCVLKAENLIYDLGSLRITQNQCETFYNKLIHNQIRFSFDKFGNVSFI